jgi:hypothetical protein
MGCIRFCLFAAGEFIEHYLTSLPLISSYLSCRHSTITLRVSGRDEVLMDGRPKPSIKTSWLLMDCHIPYRLMERYFVVAIDGTGVLVFQVRHCPCCLTKTHDGKTFYYHNVLEAKLVTPNDFAFFYITGGNFFIRPEIISQGSSMKPPRTTFSPIATFHR